MSDLKFPSLKAPQKRIVLQRADGVEQIAGLIDGELPDMIVLPGEESIPFGLLQVKPRYVVYKQVSEGPATGRLGEFHPSQI